MEILCGFFKWQVPVLSEQEYLSYITGAAMKIEVTMVYCVETTKKLLL